MTDPDSPDTPMPAPEEESPDESAAPTTAPAYSRSVAPRAAEEPIAPAQEEATGHATTSDGRAAAASNGDEPLNAIDRFFDSKRFQNTPQALNAEFQAEARDPQWASYAERQLGDFIDRHPSAHAYETRLIECRASLCQVYAEVDKSMAHALQSGTPPSMDPLAALPHDSLANDFEVATAAFGTADEDYLNMVITLRRRD